MEYNKPHNSISRHDPTKWFVAVPSSPERVTYLSLSRRLLIPRNNIHKAIKTRLLMQPFMPYKTSNIPLDIANKEACIMSWNRSLIFLLNVPFRRPDGANIWQRWCTPYRRFSTAHTYHLISSAYLSGAKWTNEYRHGSECKHFMLYMMTSSNGNIFRVTGHLCGEFTGPRPVTRSFAMMFSLICVWVNDWVNNREAGDLRRYRAHYDVSVMFIYSYVCS